MLNDRQKKPFLIGKYFDFGVKISRYYSVKKCKSDLLKRGLLE